MRSHFQPNGRAVLIGSLPLESHEEAMQLVLDHTAEIPLWVQLPIYPQEKMVPQFIDGMPGLKVEPDGFAVDTASSRFEEEMLAFYEDYMAVTNDGRPISASRFAIERKTAPGLALFNERIPAMSPRPVALKGQITGPFTFTTSIYDQNGLAIYYDPQVRDAAVKLLALKARGQAQQLGAFQLPVLVFIDEPALAGFGTSEFLSVSKEDVVACLNEVIEAVHSQGALAGVHVCANTDWSLVFDTAVDIVSFDAYSYFDRFILYADQLCQHINEGNIIAWGVVPTGDVEAIQRETTNSLFNQWEEKLARLETLGLSPATITAQALITPSCGTGALPVKWAQRVLELTQAVSVRIRSLPTG